MSEIQGLVRVLEFKADTSLAPGFRLVGLRNVQWLNLSRGYMGIMENKLETTT